MEIELDGELAAAVAGGTWEPVPGTSRASVWEVGFDDDRPSVFVKAGVEAGSGGAVDDEIRRWEWLETVVPARSPEADAGSSTGDAGPPVPALLGHQDPDGPDGGAPAMISAAAVGVPELHWFAEPPAAAEVLGTALRAVHALPVESCPFDAGPQRLMALAEARVATGTIDPAQFHAAHQRYSPAALLDHAKALTAPDPEGPDRVVVHGDWSIGNLIVRPDTGRLTGIVDWAGLGVGDRHLDLATGARSLVAHFGGECLPRFLEAYGFGEPDALRLEFYSLLDQFR